jgi:hypothetical protein
MLDRSAFRSPVGEPIKRVLRRVMPRIDRAPVVKSMMSRLAQMSACSKKLAAATITISTHAPAAAKRLFIPELPNVEFSGRTTSGRRE